jgi:two-component system chemotaxis response regulator CheB
MARVLVVDDSAFVRKALARVLMTMPEIHAVDAVASAREALVAIDAKSPDVVTLDVDMPHTDGLAALREIVRRHPGLPVIMLSALTRRGAAATLEALALGAVDFIDKTSFSVMDLDVLGRELSSRIRHFARRAPRTVPARARPTALPVLDAARFDVCVIGASTGGPAAIESILRALPATFPLPIVIVQHMPVGFTRSFAERLDALSALHVVEAIDGAALAPGIALVAPAGQQLRVEARVVRVVGPTPASVHAPSVDLAMTSAAAAYRGRVLGVLLTGMGDDGAAGMQAILDVDGVTIAESEETCVVFGMPRAAVLRGATVHLLPLFDIVTVLARMHARDRWAVRW